MASSTSDTLAASTSLQPSNIRRMVDTGPSDLACVITVNVGTESECTSFILHESLLRKISKFFDNALKRDWQESTERIVALPEASPAAFTIYAKFLVTGLLFLEQANELAIFSEGATETGSSSCPAMAECLECAQLADFLQATNFGDAVADAVLETIADVRRLYGEGRVVCMHAALQCAYMITKAGSPIRKLFLDLCVYAWGNKEEVVPRDLDRLDSEILADYINTIRPYLVSGNSVDNHPNPVSFRDTCNYHEHLLTGDACYKTKRQYPDGGTQSAGMNSISRMTHED
ncbi:hypothetical protein NX059_010135 [Plenodomus lindquistii]|nr:hypothetical protein NX059_010135 [Plenodomus lindquistii]